MFKLQSLQRLIPGRWPEADANESAWRRRPQRLSALTLLLVSMVSSSVAQAGTCPTDVVAFCARQALYALENHPARPFASADVAQCVTDLPPGQHDPGASTHSYGQSKNYGPICAAALYIHSPAAAQSWWSQYFDIQSGAGGLMSNEIFSPVYAGHQIGAVMMVRARTPQSDPLHAKATQWLRAIWGALALVSHDSTFTRIDTYRHPPEDAPAGSTFPYIEQDAPLELRANDGWVTVAAAGPRHNRYGRQDDGTISSPAYAHATPIHSMFSAALGRAHHRSGAPLPPWDAACWTSGPGDCWMKASIGWVLFAKSLGFTFNSAGELTNQQVPEAPPEAFGLSASERAALNTAVQSQPTANAINTAKDLVGKYRLYASGAGNCVLSIWRSNSEIATWMGGDGSDQAQLGPCHPARGPFSAFTYRFSGVGARIGEVIAPSSETDVPSSWRFNRDTADGKLCARSGAGDRYCLNGPNSGTPIFHLIWDQNGLRNASGGGGQTGSCPTNAERLGFAVVAPTVNLGHPSEVSCQWPGGNPYTATIRLRNTGTTPWPTDASANPFYRFGVRGGNGNLDLHPFSWSTRSIAIREVVGDQDGLIECGETAEFDYPLDRLPGDGQPEPGEYVMHMGLVDDGADGEWFPELVDASITIPEFAASVEVSGLGPAQCHGGSSTGVLTVTNEGTSNWLQFPNQAHLTTNVAPSNLGSVNPAQVALHGRNVACGQSITIGADTPYTFTTTPESSAGTATLNFGLRYGQVLPDGNSTVVTRPLSSHQIPVQCDGNSMCMTNSDCAAGEICVGGSCTVPSGPAANGEQCSTDADCLSGHCWTAYNTCQAPDPAGALPAMLTVIRPDSVMIDGRVNQIVDVLANDSDQEGRPLKISEISGFNIDGIACSQHKFQMADGYLLFDGRDQTEPCSMRYRVAAADVSGDVDLGWQTVTMFRPQSIQLPVITQNLQPTLTVDLGAPFSLTVTAQNGMAFTWQAAGPAGNVSTNGNTSTYQVISATAAHAGAYSVKVCTSPGSTHCVDSVTTQVTVRDPSAGVQQSYYPAAPDAAAAGWPTGTLIQAEHYDRGGPGVAFADTDFDEDGNPGTQVWDDAARQTDVDVMNLTDTGGNAITVVHRLDGNDYVEYSIRNTQVVPIRLSPAIRASGTGPLAVSLFNDNTAIQTHLLTLSNGNDFAEYVLPLSTQGLAMTIPAASTRILRLSAGAGLSNARIDWLSLRVQPVCPGTGIGCDPLIVDVTNGDDVREADEFDAGPMGTFDRDIRLYVCGQPPCADSPHLRLDADVDLRQHWSERAPGVKRNVIEKSEAGEVLVYTFKPVNATPFRVHGHFAQSDTGSTYRVEIVRKSTGVTEATHVVYPVVSAAGFDSLVLIPSFVPVANAEYLLRFTALQGGARLGLLTFGPAAVTAVDDVVTVPFATSMNLSYLDWKDNDVDPANWIMNQFGANGDPNIVHVSGEYGGPGATGQFTLQVRQCDVQVTTSCVPPKQVSLFYNFKRSATNPWISNIATVTVVFSAPPPLTLHAIQDELAFTDFNSVVVGSGTARRIEYPTNSPFVITGNDNLNPFSLGFQRDLLWDPDVTVFPSNDSRVEILANGEPPYLYRSRPLKFALKQHDVPSVDFDYAVRYVGNGANIPSNRAPVHVTFPPVPLVPRSDAITLVAGTTTFVRRNDLAGNDTADASQVSNIDPIVLIDNNGATVPAEQFSGQWGWWLPNGNATTWSYHLCGTDIGILGNGNRFCSTQVLPSGQGTASVTATALPASVAPRANSDTIRVPFEPSLLVPFASLFGNDMPNTGLTLQLVGAPANVSLESGGVRINGLATLQTQFAFQYVVVNQSGVRSPTAATVTLSNDRTLNQAAWLRVLQ